MSTSTAPAHRSTPGGYVNDRVLLAPRARKRYLGTAEHETAEYTAAHRKRLPDLVPCPKCGNVPRRGGFTDPDGTCRGVVNCAARAKENRMSIPANRLVLEALREHEAIAFPDLQQQTHVSPGKLTSLLHHFRKVGLVEFREHASGHHRAIDDIRITPKGLAVDPAVEQVKAFVEGYIPPDIASGVALDIAAKGVMDKVATQDPETLLWSLVREGPVSAEDVRIAFAKAGFSKGGLHRAKQALGVVNYMTGSVGRGDMTWWYALPADLPEGQKVIHPGRKPKAAQPVAKDDNELLPGPVMSTVETPTIVVEPDDFIETAEHRHGVEILDGLTHILDLRGRKAQQAAVHRAAEILLDAGLSDLADTTLQGVDDLTPLETEVMTLLERLGLES